MCGFNLTLVLDFLVNFRIALFGYEQQPAVTRSALYKYMDTEKLFGPHSGTTLLCCFVILFLL